MQTILRIAAALCCVALTGFCKASEPVPDMWRLALDGQTREIYKRCREEAQNPQPEISVKPSNDIWTNNLAGLTDHISANTLKSINSLICGETTNKLVSIALAGLWAKAAEESVESYVTDRIVSRITNNLNRNWPGIFRGVTVQQIPLSETDVNLSSSLKASLDIKGVTAAFSDSKNARVSVTNGQPLMFRLDYVLDLSNSVAKLQSVTNGAWQPIAKLPMRFRYLPELRWYLKEDSSANLKIDQYAAEVSHEGIVDTFNSYSFTPASETDSTGIMFFELNTKHLKGGTPVDIKWNNWSFCYRSWKCFTAHLGFERDDAATPPTKTKTPPLGYYVCGNEKRLSTGEGFHFYKVNTNDLSITNCSVPSINTSGIYVICSGEQKWNSDNTQLVNVFAIIFFNPMAKNNMDILKMCARVRASKDTQKTDYSEVFGNGLVFSVAAKQTPSQ